MNTNIKNFLNKGLARKFTAALGVGLAVFTMAFFIQKPPVANAGTQCASFYTLTATSSYDAATDKYALNAKTTYLGTDQSDLFTYQWVITNVNGPVTLSENTASFEDALPNIAQGNYLVSITATAIPGKISGGDCYINQNVNLSFVKNAATGGYTAKITSVKQEGAVDSSGNIPYRIIAEVDDSKGNVISGGSGSNPQNNGFSWTWVASTSTLSGTQSTQPIGNGFNLLYAFQPGSYYITATAKPDPSFGPAVSTNPNTDPLATLVAGQASGHQFTITYNRSANFDYIFDAQLDGVNGVTTTTSNGSGGNNTTTVDVSKSYSWAWSVATAGGTAQAQGNNGYEQKFTLKAGANTITSVITFPDHSTLKNNVTLTLDQTGAVTAVNGSSSAGSDACSNSAQGVTCIVGEVVGTLLGWGVQFMTWFTANYLLPISIAVIGIQVHTSAFSAVIIQEWVFLRNFCNIFFIATLIIIGLGTMFSVGTYDPKKILPKLVISALLINFSLAIAQAILGVADVLQAQFLGSDKAQSTVILQNLAYRLMVAPLLHVSAAITSSASGITAALFTELVYFFVAITAIFVFAALTAYLIVRIVVVWLLLMTSPIAFATSFVPDKKISGWSATWRENFFKYAFFTPMIALCLHVCALLASTQSTFTAATINGQLSSLSTTSAVNAFQVSSTDVLGSLLVAACLVASLKIASSMGIAGAKQINGFVDKAQSKVLGVPKWAGNYVGDVANRKRREWSSQLVNDKDGNLRRGKTAILGRGLNAIINPDAMLKSMSTAFDAKNKTAAELAQLRSDKLQVRNSTGKFWNSATGVDTKGDTKMLGKKHDEEVAKYVSMSSKDLREAFNRATNEDVKGKIYTAQLQKGEVRRNFEMATGRKVTDDEMDSEISRQVNEFSSGVKKKLVKSLNHVADEKKDLSLSNLDLDKNARQTKGIETMDEWSPEDAAKAKISSLYNDKMTEKLVSQIVKGGVDVADSINQKSLNAIAEKSPTAFNEMQGAMSDERFMRLAGKMTDRDYVNGPASKPRTNAEEIKNARKSQEFVAARLDKMITQGSTDVVEKMPKAFFRALDSSQFARAVAKMKPETAMKLDDSLYLKEIDGTTARSADALEQLVTLINRHPEKAKSLSDNLISEIAKLPPGARLSSDVNKVLGSRARP